LHTAYYTKTPATPRPRLSRKSVETSRVQYGISQYISAISHSLAQAQQADRAHPRFAHHVRVCSGQRKREPKEHLVATLLACRANAVLKEKGPAFNRHYMVMWRSQRVWRADHGLECSSAEVQPPYFRRGPSASWKRTRTTLRPQTYRCTTFPGVCTSSALIPMMRLGDEFLVRLGPGLNNLRQNLCFRRLSTRESGESVGEKYRREPTYEA
jgi:hypothetical protein